MDGKTVYKNAYRAFRALESVELHPEADSDENEAAFQQAILSMAGKNYAHIVAAAQRSCSLRTCDDFYVGLHRWFRFIQSPIHNKIIEDAEIAGHIFGRPWIGLEVYPDYEFIDGYPRMKAKIAAEKAKSAELQKRYPPFGWQAGHT